MSWSKDEAEKLFINQLGGKLVNVDKYGFSREFEFVAEDVTYKVVWFHNQSTLILNGLRVIFYKAEISNTWPSPAGSKNKLQIYDKEDEIVAVIVLERF